jgi:hypothetical protein
MAKTVRELFKVGIFSVLRMLLPKARDGWQQVNRKNDLDIR